MIEIGSKGEMNSVICQINCIVSFIAIFHLRIGAALIKDSQKPLATLSSPKVVLYPVL